MAILKFRIYYQVDETVYRDIAIKHTQTFFELHQAIVQAFEFDGKQPAVFHRSNDKWQKGKSIALALYENQYKVQPLIMSETIIASEIKDPNQRFLYDYDLIKNWQFYIELILIEKIENKKLSYPAIVRKTGISPAQYAIKDHLEKKTQESLMHTPDELADGFSETGIDELNGGV